MTQTQIQTQLKLTFRATQLEDTDRLGAVLAECLPDGTTVSLCGTLGAGKTRLVQAVAAACGIERESVASPTFVLCQHYQGVRTIHHLDAYRLKDSAEFVDLGVEELFSTPAVTLVEWGDRVADVLPRERLEIRIDITGDEAREFSVVATPALAAVLGEVAKRLDKPVRR